MASVAQASVTSVAASASSVTLAAVNGRRQGMIVCNDSSVTCYVKYGTTASSTSFTYKLAAGVHWEMPQPIYVGEVDVIWESATGSARVTEVY